MGETKKEYLGTPKVFHHLKGWALSYINTSSTNLQWLTSAEEGHRLL